MQDLTPVGLSRDGTRLVLVSATGQEFSVVVDTRLRAALRGDSSRLGQLEMKMESALRPRDIQSRIRAGESPEEVATAAQTTVDAIMGFATPVLAERAHVAQTALRASVRRRSGESSSAGRTLGEAAELFFGDHSLHDEDVEWDAWRQADGRWALVATYAVGGTPRRAEFTHDLPGRYVVAENDEARILTGEVREPESRQPAGSRTPSSRRLSSVPSQDELPLGDDAIELVREPAADEPVDLTDVPTPTSTDVAADAGGERDAHETAQPAPAHKSAEASEATEATEAGQAPPLPDPGDVTADADWIAESDAATGSQSRPATPEEVDAGPGAEVGGEADAEPATDTPAPKKKSRSSVPSWDEIMFGGKSE